MTARMGWGLVGPGGIAHRFADALATRHDARLHAVVGRTPERSHAFAERWGARVHADIDPLLADPAVEAVYIATPHSSHAEVADACLRAGKPVLCEKPLAANAEQAEALIRLARKRGVFLMEALWTRHLPALCTAEAWLRDIRIGRVRALQSSFGFHMPFDANHRVFAPALAGGALLDIGIYNVAMTRWVLESQRGRCPAPDRISAQAVLAPTGVDQRVAATLSFPGGTVSQFVCAVDGSADNAMRIGGELGHIEVPHHFWEATEARLCRTGHAPEQVQAPFRVNGFEGQIEETMRCVRSGLIESPQMPHAESLAIVACLDELRRAVGVRYPFE